MYTVVRGHRASRGEAEGTFGNSFAVRFDRTMTAAWDLHLASGSGSLGRGCSVRVESAETRHLMPQLQFEFTVVFRLCDCRVIDIVEIDPVP